MQFCLRNRAGTREALFPLNVLTMSSCNMNIDNSDVVFVEYYERPDPTLTKMLKTTVFYSECLNKTSCILHFKVD